MSIGGRHFGYDGVSRLVTALIPGATPWPFRGYRYDAVGNRTRMTPGVLVQSELGQTLDLLEESVEELPIHASTNRLAGASHDAAGSVTGYQGQAYTWDAVEQMATVDTGLERWWHAYDASGERVWSRRTSSVASGPPTSLPPHAGEPLERLTFRGLDGKVLRELTRVGSGSGSAITWSGEEYFHREGQLWATRRTASDGTSAMRHHALDHLGTIRLTTDASGETVSRHDYFPYGEETPIDGGTDGERMKFTGHERDLGAWASSADDLDYMHARYYKPIWGRFLSVDPVGGTPEEPQSWNRYAYVQNNPLGSVDPDGRSLWKTAWKVIRHSPEGTRTVVELIRGRSKQKAIERARTALDTIDNRQTSQGAKRVLQASSDEARDAMARQLSTDKALRGPEKSGGGLPEHVHPNAGSYTDVHVETAAKVGVAAAGASFLQQLFAPATSAVVSTGEATPTELLSAGAWDAVTAVDPTGASDLINWVLDIDQEP